MIQIKIMSNTVRKTIATDEHNKIADVLTANNVNYEHTPIYLDGAPLSYADYDKTFSELNVTEKCTLTAVIKTENA